MTESEATNAYRPSLHQAWTNFVFGERRLPGWLVWGLAIAATGVLSWAIAQAGILVALGLILLVTAVPVAASVLWNTQTGIYIMVLFAYFLSVINRLLPTIPMGIAIDAMILFMLMGMMYRCHQRKDWSPFHSPVSVAYALWGAMNVIEFANPVAASRAAWFYVIRPALGYMMLYFLTYGMLHKKQQMYHLLFFLLAINLVSALWGIYQYFFEYFDWEMAHIIRADAVHLVFNDGRWRSFGSLGTPAQYGILMAYTGCLCWMMVTGFARGFRRYFLIVAGFCCFAAMLYSGTRSSFVIPGIFYFVWVILSRNKWLYASLLVGALGVFVLANVPTNNYQLQRMQTIFKASEDKSYQTRARNREIIAPWILKHPIGGGLGSTGVWGMRFSPGTFLANFPPDSGLVRVAVELGWVGLIIFLNLYISVIVRAFQAYWKMENPQYKCIVAGIVCGIPALLLVEWGQEVVGVFPISILFWIVTAILFKAIALDKEERELAQS
jgi:hypothetical protein